MFISYSVGTKVSKSIILALKTGILEYLPSNTLIQQWDETNLDPRYGDENLKNEYFAWAIENWFDANLDGSCGSSTTQGFESGYLATKFSTSNIWKATCLGKP